MENITSEKMVSPEFGSNEASTLETTLTQRHWTSHLFYTVTVYLWITYLPAIFFLGTFGNVMTIIIMHRLASEESTIYMYFKATAVTDLIYLITLGMLQWLYCQLGYGLDSSQNLLFSIHGALYTGSGTISCWFLVCVTVHRAISVVWPHRVNLLCTRRTVSVLIAAITVIVGSIYSYHVLLHLDTPEPRNDSVQFCGKLSVDYVFFNQDAFVYIDLLVYCILPFLFIAVSNTVLVWKLRVSVKVASKHLTTRGPARQAQAREKAASSVTLTVLVVSTAFIVFTLPLTLNQIVNHSAMNGLIELQDSGNVQDFIQSPMEVNLFTDHQKLAKANFTQSVCMLLSLTNSAINFYLYCLTGRKFREEFIRIICCCCGIRKGQRTEVSQLRGDASHGFRDQSEISGPSSSVLGGAVARKAGQS